ncbi:hypothetical protein T08_647 [Trichinella sp. T8]|nr:hypothetical protein T08_647 [Trichinella sp. T8]
MLNLKKTMGLLKLKIYHSTNETANSLYHLLLLWIVLTHGNVNANTEPLCSSYAKQCPFANGVESAYLEWILTRNDTFAMQLLTPDNVRLRYFPPNLLCDGALLYGERACPQRLLDGGGHHHGINERSLCPWYWTVNYDPLRIPPSLPEARCACDRAVLPPNLSYECETVTYKLKVLRFDPLCENYIPTVAKLAIGCTPIQETTYNVLQRPISETLFAPYEY